MNLKVTTIYNDVTRSSNYQLNRQTMQNIFNTYYINYMQLGYNGWSVR